MKKTFAILLAALTVGLSSASWAEEVARYRTWFDGTAVHIGDAWGGAAPSRTAVDKDGNAYVANRGFQNYGYPGWAYVFKMLNSSSVDRNSNGVVDTSTDTNNDGCFRPTAGTLRILPSLLGTITPAGPNNVVTVRFRVTIN